MENISRKLEGQPDDTSNPSYRLIVGGDDLGGKFQTMSLVVHKAANKIPVAQLVIIDGNIRKQVFEASDSDLFKPGQEVTIKLGYRQKESDVFTGIITKHGIKIREGQPTMLVLELKDKAVKLTTDRKNEYFENKKDSEIIEKKLANIEKTVEATDVTHLEMVQHYSTDWDFIVARAEANGMLVFVDNGKVSVKKPDLSKPSLGELAFGFNIYEFEAEIDARDQYENVIATEWKDIKASVADKQGVPPSWDEQGELSGKELSAVTGNSVLSLKHGGKRSDIELEKWATAKLMRSRLSKIRGRVKIEGYNVVKPGDIISLADFSSKFNGNAFVSEVRHELSSHKTWYTDIKFGLSQEFHTKKYPDVMDVPASGLVPGINGLHIGKVVSIHDDPAKEFRVQVNLPLIGIKGLWARIATLDAGNEYGMYSRPHKDDEVIVGFVNDDPRDAIILGCLHSSVNAPPETPEDKNYKKAFVTKEKIKLTFDDETKSITIETPGKNTVVISDKENTISLTDSNKNKIVMDNNGITIESSKDLTLKASKGDIKVEGLNITNKAKAQFKGEGTGGAELSSSGAAVIKGSQVQIN